MIRVFVYVGDVKVTGANYQLVITEKKRLMMMKLRIFLLSLPYSWPI